MALFYTWTGNWEKKRPIAEIKLGKMAFFLYAILESKLIIDVWEMSKDAKL